MNGEYCLYYTTSYFIIKYLFLKIGIYKNTYTYMNAYTHTHAHHIHIIFIVSLNISVALIEINEQIMFNVDFKIIKTIALLVKLCVWECTDSIIVRERHAHKSVLALLTNTLVIVWQDERNNTHRISGSLWALEGRACSFVLACLLLHLVLPWLRTPQLWPLVTWLPQCPL